MNISDKALELIIRDVLGGMQELATMEGYRASLECMEVLGVEPADPQLPKTPSPHREAVVLVFPNLKKTA